MENPTTETRYSRNILLFGEEGQRRLERTSAAIIGLGGLGSHVAQQLAYLGVGQFLLIDPDLVETSNLNRLVGAKPQHVQAGASKVQVAKDLIKSTNVDARIRVHKGSLQDVSDTELLNACDLIFGCLDNDLARLKLVEQASRKGLPYIDIASDVGKDRGGVWFGGRVLFAHDGKGCLVCLGLLDQEEIRSSGLSAEQREEDLRIYGVPTGFGKPGPAVVTVNGVVASLALTEFMAWRTRLRVPNRLLIYRGDLGVVTKSLDTPATDCHYCSLFSQTQTSRQANVGGSESTGS